MMNESLRAQENQFKAACKQQKTELMVRFVLEVPQILVFTASLLSLDRLNLPNWIIPTMMRK
jgi:hypothetical protein